MKEIIKGHEYALSDLKSNTETILRFYRDSNIHGEGHDGPSTQEVLRACIARVKALDEEVPWDGNSRIIYHLRMAIAEFEYRAIIRNIETGYAIEDLFLYDNGHIIP